jgi:hypothetical protein
LRPASATLGKAAKNYAEGLGKGLLRAAKKHGPVDGERAFKWLRRLALGGGAYAGLAPLIAKFPEAFSWLERILNLVK